MSTLAKFEIRGGDNEKLLLAQLGDIGRISRSQRPRFTLKVFIPTLPDGRGLLTDLRLIVDGLRSLDTIHGESWSIEADLRREDITLTGLQVTRLLGEGSCFGVEAEYDSKHRDGKGEIKLI